MLNKRLGLALSLLVISGSLVVAARYIIGQPNQQSAKLKMRVLRGKDNLKLKPTAQEIASFKAQSEEDGRKLEDEIPKHIPLKIKIKKEKEKEFKDLKNEKWARDFELEVTNTGEKTIYFLSVYLFTDVKAAKGYDIAFPLDFGPVELGDIRVKARPIDIGILPGETVVLKIHPGNLAGWEIGNREEKRPHPKKLRAIFQFINFGDGTGFVGTEGLPIPRITNQRSGFGTCIPKGFGDLPDLLAWQIAPERTETQLNGNSPASLLPVNFFSNLSKTASVASTAPPQDCCPGIGCTTLIPFVEIACVNCPPQQRPIIRVVPIQK